MFRAPLCALAAVTLLCGSALAGSSLELTDKTFEKTVVNSEDPFFVLFYAPWCGHCKAIAPKWDKAAAAVAGIVTMAQVDADKYGSLSQKYGVSGFPTIKIFGADKKAPKDYQGQRETEGLVQGAMQAAQDVINKRLGKGGSSGGGGGGGGGHGSGGPSDVVELTEQTFQAKVLDSEELWIVAFTAPWCGHCKNLIPQFESASADLKGKAKLGNVDATVHGELAQKFNVNGYPTIKVFPGGKKSGEAEDYEGGRSASDFVTFGEEEFLKNAPPPEVIQAINASAFESECVSKQICFVAFLPLLQDSLKAGRLEHIETMKATAEKYKRRPFGWVWVEATVQPDIENVFGVGGFGYPALSAFNAKKMRYSTMKGQFSPTGLKEFVNRLIAGRGTLALNKDALPALVKTDGWDGEDFDGGAFEEEFDLSDLDDIDMDDDESAKDEL